MGSHHIEAIYEDGVLKPDKPLPLAENQRVHVVVETKTNWVQQTAGLMKWNGSAELAEQFAMSPELDPMESS